MVACFILATCLIFIAGIWGIYHTSLNKSKNVLVATSLARSVIEQKISLGYAALAPILDNPEVQTIVSRSQIRGRLVETPYTVEAYATDTSEPGMRRLIVKLDWSEPQGVKKLRYETFVFRTQ
jgi:hypothetical protein